MPSTVLARTDSHEIDVPCDPRPDLSADSPMWNALLRRARDADPALADALWAARQRGGLLGPHPDGGVRLWPGDGWRDGDEYEEFKRSRLAPHGAALTELLRGLSFEDERSGGAGGAVTVLAESPATLPGWRRISGRDDLERECAAARTAGLCGLDVETAPRPGVGRLYGPWPDRAGLDPYLARVRVVQLAVPGRRPAIMDLAPWWDDPAALAGVLQPLAALLADPSAVKVGHNLSFDLKMLRGALGGGPLDVENVFDTMLAAQLLACGLWPTGREGFTLASVARRECGLELDKRHQRSDWSGPLSESQLEYAANDAAVLLPLYHVLARKLRDGGLMRAAALEFRCVPATADLEYAGIGFDRAAWAALAEEERAALADAETRALNLLDPGGRAQTGLFKSGAPSLNLNSPQQLLAAFRRLGASLPDTQDATLQQLVKAGGTAGDAARALLAYRKHAKALSGFIEPYEQWAHPVTGRIHSEYRQLNRNGVGRFSAANPNIQQLPRSPRFRGAFVAAPGRVLVKADYAAIEVRIMAWLSGDLRLAGIFISGADPHRRTAALIMQKPESDVTKDERQLAKAVNFGLLYGMSAGGLRAYAAAGYGVEMTREQTAEFRRRYFQAYQGVAAWHRKQDRYARAARMVRTASGRARRWLSSRMPLPELLNTPDQGTGADILKRAMADLRPHLKRLGAELVASVHDELVVETPADKAVETAAVLQRVMVEAGAAFIAPIPVEVEYEIAHSWAG